MSTTNLPPLLPMPEFSAWSDACGMSHARDGFSPQELGEYATAYGATCAAAARAQALEDAQARVREIWANTPNELIAEAFCWVLADLGEKP